MTAEPVRDSHGNVWYPQGFAHTLRRLVEQKDRKFIIIGVDEAQSIADCLDALAASRSGVPRELSAEWCMEAFYRVNPGAARTMPQGIPSLYLLDFAREVLALASPLSVPDENAVARKAASDAITALCQACIHPEFWRKEGRPMFRSDEHGIAHRFIREAGEKYIAEHYPAPVAAVASCVLDDGSVVILDKHGALSRGNGTRTASLHWWPSLLDKSDTGADFDRLKAFVAALPAPGART